MGAWGVDVFENDGAGDFLAEFGDAADPLAVLAAALEEAAVDDYLESDVGMAAVAAAALVAGVRSGVAGDAVEAEVLAGVSLTASDVAELVDVACGALVRVAADDSELAELWDETEHAGAWRATLTAVHTRLTT